MISRLLTKFKNLIASLIPEEKPTEEIVETPKKDVTTIQPDIPIQKIMKYKETFQQSPNISRGRVITPTAIILHHTAGSFAGSVSWCLNSASQVSYHCIVNTNGDRTVLAQDTQRAWHAGVSQFKGRKDCNSFTLGIAVSGNTNTRLLTEDEINSVAEWCVEKMRKCNISIENVTTHREVSPGRKNDVDTRAEKAIISRIKTLLNL
jgi:N-acetyl-anhydromuramyl-L-alanine amidase AmpD